MIRKALSALLATATLTACGGNSYPLPAKQVRSELLSLRPPLLIFGGANVSTMVSQVGQDTIRWTVVSEYKPVMSFLAKVVPNGDSQTHVSVTVEPAPGKADSTIARNMAANPSVINLYRSAMEEQIDAKLERRTFDMSAIQGQLAVATIANIGQIKASLDEAVKNSQTMDRSIKDAVAEMEDERDSQAAIAGNDSPGDY